MIGEIAAPSHAIDALIAQNAVVLGRSAAAIELNTPEADDLVIAGALATACTQLTVAKLAVQAAERMFEAGGASATGRALNFDRHWRNLRTIFSHNPLTHKARIVGAADGFNLMPDVLPGGLQDFVDGVVPLLQRKGLFRREYTGRTLRDHLGLARPPHPLAAVAARHQRGLTV